MLAVLFYLACVGLAITVSLLGPIFVGLLAGEADIAARLGFYLLLGSFIFGGGVLALLGRLRRVPRIARLWLLALVWTVLPLLAAVPLESTSPLTFSDAVFETVSALTTTGSSVFPVIDNLPQSVIFWRVQLQWLGGYLALLTIILVMAPLGIGGLTSRRETMTNGADLRARDSRLLVFAFNLALLYATLTAACFLIFFLSGSRAFYAVTLAMTATSTGGFLPFDNSLDENLGTFGLFVFGIFLLFGATSVFWHRMLVGGKLASLTEHRESYSVIIMIVLVAVGFAVAAIGLGVGGEGGLGATLTEAFVNAASLVATSGIETRPGYFTLLPLVLVLFVVLLGGSAFSTSGGLKHYRVGGMIVQSWSELDRLVYPNIVRPSHFGTERYDIQLMKAIWSFFVVAILTIAIGTIIIATSGIPFEAALTATVATFSTAGPVYSSGWAAPGTPPWPEFADFPTQAKWLLTFIMILGRLEVLAILGLFNAQYWRNR